MCVYIYIYIEGEIDRHNKTERYAYMQSNI